ESTRGVRDMAGNVWEWQANYFQDHLALRGGSWGDLNYFARVARRSSLRPYLRDHGIGFRVCVLPA
ncbi:MAG TPA: SUMF1/EgtB/PvdO family nonheme iron enzyme, partial [Anaerolineaceae bacterium]|nr:SUMF1/EgtB/PvdO family nonheme iron enzyme [Anaerolineaceae bacterium]